MFYYVLQVKINSFILWFRCVFPCSFLVVLPFVIFSYDALRERCLWLQLCFKMLQLCFGLLFLSAFEQSKNGNRIYMNLFNRYRFIYCAWGQLSFQWISVTIADGGIVISIFQIYLFIDEIYIYIYIYISYIYNIIQTYQAMISPNPTVFHPPIETPTSPMQWPHQRCHFANHWQEKPSPCAGWWTMKRCCLVEWCWPWW